MRLDWEIKGEIKEVKKGYTAVRLYIGEDITDFFAVDIEEKEILTTLNTVPKIILKVENKFEDYMKLITDLGLEIPSTYKRHWTPKTGEDYFYIDSEGEVCPNYIANFGYNEVDQKRYENYNMFPARELAEKTINISKLGRLILLWQYANDCIFTPTWKNNSQRKYFIKHDHINNTISYYYGISAQLDTVHFETIEQVEAFIKVYDKEIKKIMGVKS